MITMACASKLKVLQHIDNTLTKISRQNRWTSVLSLLIATVLRTFLVIISYGCKVPAGIFVPSMAIGASFGRMVGILVQAIQQAFPNSAFFSACQPDMPCITPGTYAFLGAAAALSGIMHITVSVVVIMFELTGALTYILPTMVSSLLLPHHFTTLTSPLRSL
jgi:chloride channel 3/4/5